MRSRTRQILTGAAVAGLAIAALRAPTPTLGDPAVLFGALDLQPWTQHDTLGDGETLSGFLESAGLSSRDAANVIAAATPLDPRRIPAGMKVELVGDTTDVRPREIRFKMSVEDGFTADDRTTQSRVEPVRGIDLVEQPMSNGHGSARCRLPLSQQGVPGGSVRCRPESSRITHPCTGGVQVRIGRAHVRIEKEDRCRCSEQSWRW